MAPYLLKARAEPHSATVRGNAGGQGRLACRSHEMARGLRWFLGNP